MFKKILSLFIAACLLSFVFTSCRTDGTDSSPTDTSVVESTDDTTVITGEGTTADNASSDTPNEKATSIKFSIFSDFHYKVGMYMSSIADLEKIIDRANANSVDFLMQTGDFSNDYAGSPEATNTYLKNKYNIPAYGVYGNHELESGNNMDYVTPLLNSDPDSVVWGTADGKMSDKSIGYYYFELNGFRIICLDTNYSYNQTKKMWEHNYADSYGRPAGNVLEHSLGTVQEEWLITVLQDAADKDIPCVIFSHMGFSGIWTSTYNHADIRNIFNKANERNPGTVVAAINGHLHTDNSAVIDGIVYLGINTVRNCWLADHPSYHHYTTETFQQMIHDKNGNPIISLDVRVKSLTQAKSTWFYAEPLNAIITIHADGTVIVEGAETGWFADIEPFRIPANGTPVISSGTYYAMGKK